MSILASMAATSASATAQQARSRALLLYRDMLRQVPASIEQFNLDKSREDFRVMIRHHFEKHRDVKDPDIIDRLVFMGRLELEEVHKLWKQKPHILKHFETTAAEIAAQKMDAHDDEAKLAADFQRRFYKGHHVEYDV
eukprot:CAMPEP_0177669234 /NCGR_PEP_ID=MMETSP0447-20121125/23312_1 /TAXON_ID=0 /ORGANISM="Stygamoeba regulata, Strain BSH-02190019" /LENGTH=137 /DNA_ID=CAMNT_0019176047 /DNA_START=23 /DNA_END=436 /DNA_ORIENTATION=-